MFNNEDFTELIILEDDAKASETRLHKAAARPAIFPYSKLVK